MSLPEFRGCPFENADAEAPAGECQELATKEYRDWLRQFFLELAADTGVTDSDALADALIVLYNGALTTANTAEPARSAARMRVSHRRTSPTSSRRRTHCLSRASPSSRAARHGERARRV